MYCKLCGVSCSSDYNYREHIAGRKHRARQAQQQSGGGGSSIGGIGSGPRSAVSGIGTSKRADAGKEPPAHISTSRPVVAIRSVSFLRLAAPAPHRVLVPPPPAAAAPPPRPRQVGRKIRHWSLQHQHCLLQDVALHSGSEEVATKVPLAPTNTSVLATLAWILMTGLPPRHL